MLAASVGVGVFRPIMGGGVSRAAHEALRVRAWELETARQDACDTLKRVRAEYETKLEAQREAVKEEVGGAHAAMLAGRGPEELQRMLDAMNEEQLKLEARLQREREERIAHLQQMAARRLGQMDLARGWCAWLEMYDARRQTLDLLRGAAGRLIRPKIAAAVAHWQCDWRDAELRRAAQAEALRDAVKDELEKVQTELAARNAALGQIEEHDKERLARVEMAAVRRLSQMDLARGWGAWLEAYDHRTRSLKLLRVAAGRLARPKLAAAILHWRRDWRKSMATSTGQVEQLARAWARQIVATGLVPTEIDALTVAASLLPTKPPPPRVPLAGGDTQASLLRSVRPAPTLTRRPPSRHSGMQQSMSQPELPTLPRATLLATPPATPPAKLLATPPAALPATPPSKQRAASPAKQSAAPPVVPMRIRTPVSGSRDWRAAAYGWRTPPRALVTPTPADDQPNAQPSNNHGKVLREEEPSNEQPISTRASAQERALAEQLERAEWQNARLSERLQVAIASANERVAQAEANAARVEQEADAAQVRAQRLERQLLILKRQRRDPRGSALPDGDTKALRRKRGSELLQAGAQYLHADGRVLADGGAASSAMSVTEMLLSSPQPTGVGAW